MYLDLPSSFRPNNLIKKKRRRERKKAREKNSSEEKEKMFLTLSLKCCAENFRENASSNSLAKKYFRITFSTQALEPSLVSFRSCYACNKTLTLDKSDGPPTTHTLTLWSTEGSKMSATTTTTTTTEIL